MYRHEVCFLALAAILVFGVAACSDNGPEPGSKEEEIIREARAVDPRPPSEFGAQRRGWRAVLDEVDTICSALDEGQSVEGLPALSSHSADMVRRLVDDLAAVRASDSVGRSDLDAEGLGDNEETQEVIFLARLIVVAIEYQCPEHLPELDAYLG